ncbi:Bacterial extracellular solute-binding protein, family 5 Middle [Bremerella volcania]|uniref:Bacterial extracellular solute-binding protein, family 5 Middle n=1 Tax=Bremerella volcania TaxID=2527984 RepID=A0A518C7L7_9BACT|nr:ABC transporter substrate-binding protein [Bremerella volcania]QDU75226.1 Bacterial extracellular solute-binding protein, family 5 Middle [Bremerella volcania]
MMHAIRHPYFTLAILLVLAMFAPLVAQEEEQADEKPIPVEMTKPLFEREPYDLVTVVSSKDGKPLRIKPIHEPEFRGGASERSGQITVELVDMPGRKFQIAWRGVVLYQPFPKLLIDEAKKNLSEKDFDLAFRYLQRLNAEYSNYPGVDRLLEELLVQNALERFQAGALDEALGMLEEAKRKFPNKSGIDKSIESVGLRLVQKEIDDRQWQSARMLIERFEKVYGDKFADSIRQWRDDLARRSQQQMDRAKQQIAKQDYRAALEATNLALAIDPTIPSGKERLAELVRLYPQVRIATLAAGEALPPHGTLTWSGRRNKRLIYRDLTEIVGYGPEGGEYASPFGTVVRPVDRFELSIVLRDRLTPVTGFDLSRQFQDPASQQDEILAGLTPLIEKMAVREIRQVDLTLRLPHVRPEALLGLVPRKGDVSQFPIPPNGPYRPLKMKEEGQSYVPEKESTLAASRPPSEIQLLPYPTTADAMLALQAGEVHMVDRLDPATAARLTVESPEDLVVDHYRAPTLHVLVPNLNNPYLKNRDFRRGLLYGINRQEILQSRLLGGKELDGCRLVSAPIPSGVSPDDPVSYGYDLSIAPRSYEPQMSIALQKLAEIKLREDAEAANQALIPLSKLVIGHPDSEVSRQTCLAIVQYFKRLGLPCELKTVSPEVTDPAAVEVDLLYVEVQIAEPLVDVPRMFDRYIPNVHQTQYFQLALRQLGQSQNWQEVRERFWSLHRLAHDDLLIVPLFQLQDHFVYRRSLGGVGYQPMTLFQQVERWDLAPAWDVAKN